MPAVLQRPHSLSPELARPPDERREARGPNLDRPLAQQFAGRRRDRGDRVRALVAVRTEHDHCLVHLQCDWLDARRTRLAWGDATLLSSHAKETPPATSDTAKGGQAQRPTA